MSRKIFKNKETVSTANFRFQGSSAEAAAANALEADAELDAFQSDIFKTAMPKPTEGTALAEADAQAIIEQAQADADALIAAAKVKAAEIEQEAYERGLAEGRKTGEIVADQELQAILNVYHNSISKLDKSRELLIDQLQLDLMDLVIHISEKLVKTELKTHCGAILHMIRDAVRSLRDRKHIVLFLNREDFDFVTALAETEIQEWVGVDVQIEHDTNLTRGSLRIETNSGELDGLLETKIKHIQDAFNQVVDR